MTIYGAVLVTGANSGIGLAITKYLSTKGVEVFAGYRNEERIVGLQTIEHVHPIKLDVTDTGSISSAVEAIQRKGIPLIGLINNAGLSDFGPLLEMSVDDMHRIMDVNLYGPLRVSSSALPLLIESKGRIVNIGSISGIMTEMFGGAYSISKHALEAYTDALSLELSKFGIKVSIVEPGNFKSQMLENNSEWISQRLQSIEQSKYGQEIKHVLANIDGMKQMHAALPSPQPVAEAVYHALFSEQPNKRYLVASDAQKELTLKAMKNELKDLQTDYKTVSNQADLLVHQ